jgi:transposase
MSDQSTPAPTKPSSHQVTYLGADIGKKFIDFRIGKTAGRITNNAAGYLKLQQCVKAHCAHPIQIVCEATGGYQDRFVEYWHEQKVLISVVNPRQVRDFAKSRNLLAKTDRIDAAVCEAYGYANRPPAHQAPTASQVKLCRLMTQLDNLIAMRAECKTRAHELREPFVIAQNARTLAYFDKEIKVMETELVKHRDADPALAKRANRLDEASGLSWLGALRLLGYMPELGTMTRAAAAKMAGVAPLNHDSGQMRGQRHISGGRGPVRRQLYLSCLSVVRHNPILREYFKQLRARGKAGKVAMIAVARKFLILLNAALQNDEILLRPVKNNG